MITQILIPTDFSAVATYAVKAGLDLAKVFKAKVHLLNCLDLPEGYDDTDEFEQQMYNSKVLLEDLKNQHPTVTIETHGSGKRFFDTIENFVGENKVDLVVMGSHGASGKNEFFIGSNTQKVVRLVHCPVLVVKEPLDSVHFKKVVFASGFEEEDKTVFLKMKDFFSVFKPKIYFVMIHTGSIFDPPVVVSREAMEDFQVLASPLESELHFYKDFSVESGIRHFSEEIGADLIVVSNHIRHPLKRLFVGSNVEALVNHAEIPVMSFDFEIKKTEA